MNNRYITASKLEAKKTKDLDDFNEWYNKAILDLVIEGMQLIHKKMGKIISTKPLDLLEYRHILDNTISKLKDVEMLARHSHPWANGKDSPPF